MTKDEIEQERVRFEQYWKSKPSYAQVHKETEFVGWLAAKQDAAEQRSESEEHF